MWKKDEWYQVQAKYFWWQVIIVIFIENKWTQCIVKECQVKKNYMKSFPMIKTGTDATSKSSICEIWNAHLPTNGISHRETSITSNLSYFPIIHISFNGSFYTKSLHFLNQTDVVIFDTISALKFLKAGSWRANHWRTWLSFDVHYTWN